MKSVCGAGRIEPQSGNGCAQSGANGPGSFSSDSPSPLPKRPPSAWANSDCCTWPAPSGLRAERIEPDVDALVDVADVAAEDVGPDAEHEQPGEDVGEAARGDVEQRQEGAEEHQRAAEVAGGDEHQHRRAPDDEQRPEVLQRRDREAEEPARGDREQLALLRQVAGEEDDDADLRQLGRLEVDRAEVDRRGRPRSPARRFREPRRQQQQDPGGRDQVAVALEQVVVAKQDDRRAEEASPRTKTDAWSKARLVLDPVDDDEPDRRQQGAEGEEIRVGVGQPEAQEEVADEAGGEEVPAVDEAEVADLVGLR